MGPADRAKPGPGARRARALEEFVARMRPAAPALTQRLDLAAAAIFRSFEADGVEALLLKGPALERALYHPGERRAYVDVDLLVAPAHRAAARTALRRLGYIDAHEPLGIDDVGGVVHAQTWLGGPDCEFQG